jgi:Transcriptional Coactivator p15 (PC4)
MTDQLIATIQKNSREEIRIGRSEFKGHDLVNIRVWFESEDGTMRPGKSGLAFRIELLPEVSAALSKLAAPANSGEVRDDR